MDENVIKVGSFVSLKSEAKIMELILVAKDGNPTEGTISIASPVGSSLIGKKVNDVIKVKTPYSEIEYKVIDVKNNI
ncbi:GreA/GreB family elongation factor [Patescibacteria group bacterium]|nr:GreA/GreB family elongation factor [Patescibacteria group bacterium]